jgi:type II secretory ATPase GspE/PulE/Tfp pilus assembly ATPase PilB-like protein
VRAPIPPPPDPTLLAAVPAEWVRHAMLLPDRLDGGVLHVRRRPADDHVDLGRPGATSDGSSEAAHRDEVVLEAMRVRVGAVAVTTEEHPDVVAQLLVATARQRRAPLLVAGDVVALLDGVLDEAAGRDASDVHLDATDHGLRVRLRVDGLLHELTSVPLELQAALVARVKVRAGLDVAERRLPQDGQLTHPLPDGRLDVRVATMPTRHGERVTLRLLPHARLPEDLGALGLPHPVVAALLRATEASDGLVVIAGPTGSGKTTTLHALLGRLAGSRRNVVSLEDPVERVISGTSQTQVDADLGLTFATGLRHLLRHDPDVILVGEVRDPETARLAVEAAHTGHLVLTSLHAIDAPSVVSRLTELGIARPLIADTLRLVVAQRLLGVPCPDCAAPRPSTDDGAAGVGAMDAAATCHACDGSGTRGRLAVAEHLAIDAPLRRLLRAPDADVHDALLAACRPTLREVALARVGFGLARAEDALRGTPEPGIAT